jgi:hypothetical protein
MARGLLVGDGQSDLEFVRQLLQLETSFTGLRRGATEVPAGAFEPGQLRRAIRRCPGRERP